MMNRKTESIAILREAFQKKNLTLYLGAGVSLKSNLPSWEKLLLAMYFNKISEEKLGGWRPYANYLFAIAEWYLSNSSEPLEVTARKLQKYYCNDNISGSKFLDDLYLTLYGSYLNKEDKPFRNINSQFLRRNNTTLDAIARLCESKIQGVKSVVTYNYDNLLEIALRKIEYESIYSPTSLDPAKLPIYHVHGFVPLDKGTPGSRGNEIVFTEDQYHLVARNPYHWSTLVQLQSMTNSVGLMIGLSLSDRNMRRLLDAVQDAPINSANYAFLKSPSTTPPEDDILDKIHNKAKDYLNKFQDSGIKSEQDESGGIFFIRKGIKSSQPNFTSSRSGEKSPRYRIEIAGIIEQVKLLNQEQQNYVLESLGITPIWLDDYSEIPDIINQILKSKKSKK